MAANQAIQWVLGLLNMQGKRIPACHWKRKKNRLSTLNINHHDLFPRVVSFQSLGGGGSFQQEGAIMEKRTTCKVPSYLPVIK